MVEAVLKAAGIKYRRCRFTSPPAETYAVYFDDVTTDGADCCAPSIFLHSASIEIYEPRPDDKTEASVEKAMSDLGLKWEKQDRYWLQSEQRYQVIYEFEHTEKKGAV